METQDLVPILVIALVVIIAAVVVTLAIRRMRREQLRQKFGPEYDYTVEKEGDPRKAEVALQEREKKVSTLNIHPLEENVRNRYGAEWLEIQSLFVDEPNKAVDQANRLITEVMIARGFPVEDFEQRAADLSVLYPEFVPNYRQAYQIALRNQDDGTSTEELRQAMIYYRSLFDQLLRSETPQEEKETIR